VISIHPFLPTRVVLVHEGRRVLVDMHPHALVSELIYYALQALNLEISGGQMYLILDPKGQSLCRLDEEIPAQRVLVLKRANPFASPFVFTGKISEDFPDVPVLLLSKWILAEPMKRLTFAIRRDHDANLQLTEFTDERLKAVMNLYEKGGDAITTGLSAAERNSLVFLLFGSGPEPLVFPPLHRFVLDIMAEANDLKKYELLMLFVLFLPIETHAAISELILIYDTLSPAGRDRIIALIAHLLFRSPINPAAERDFVAFLLLFAPFLFGHPVKASREFRLSGDRLVVVDGGVPMTYQGQVNAEDAVPQTLTKDWEAALKNLDAARAVGSLTKAAQAKKGDHPKPSKRLGKLAKKLASVQESVNKVFGPAQRINQFEFDSLFIAN
jgi:hypothetical protein